MMKLDLQLFGATGYKDKNLYSSSHPSTYPYKLAISFVENSINTQNNTSSITATASLTANGQYWTTSYNSILDIYWYDTKTNTRTWKKAISFTGMSGFHDSKSVSIAFDVEHNQDGTLSGYAQAVFTKGQTTSSNAPSTGDVQTDLIALTTIARVSDISVTNPDVGDTIIITLSRKDASYTDVVTYTIGSLSGTASGGVSELTRTIDTSSMKNSIYQQMGSTNASIQGTAYVETFNSNNVSIGTKSKTFILYAKESECKPNVAFDVTTTDNTSLTLTGTNTKIINGISSTRLTYTITPNNGATITSKYVVDYSDLPTSPVDSWLIYTSSLTMVAVDSRGFTTSLRKNLDIVNYFVPSLDFTAFRTTPTGSEIKVNFQGSFFNDTFGAETNTLTLGWKYRVKGTNTWTIGGTLTENTDYTINGNTFYSGNSSSATDIVLSSSAFPYNNAYDVAITYQDKIVDTFTYKVVARGFPIINWDENMANINGELYVSNEDGENKISMTHQFSTNEQIIGYWINGEPLYRKVINFGNLSNATAKSVAHNISNLKRVVKMYGYAYSSQSGFDIPIPYPSNGYIISLRCDITYVVITPMTDQTSFNECYVVLEYTKTNN